MRENRILIGAFVSSLVAHLVVALVTWRIPFVPRVDPALAAERADEVELLLVDPDQENAATPDPAQPTVFTSIPDRLASERAPERPDFLADNRSVAANRVAGSGATPRADEEGPFPQVEIQQEQLDGAGGVAFSQTPLPDPRQAQGSPAAGAEGEDDRKADADRQEGQGEWALPREQREAGGRTQGERDDQTTDRTAQPELEDWWGGQAPSVLKDGQQAASGDRGFEFDQKSQGSLGDGVVNIDDFSLNTVDWQFAPWIRDFANKLHRHWKAPYAYFPLGVISGSTTLKMVVEKDGTLSSLEVLEKDGHESLHEASQAALRAFAPYTPLPPDFPEENLVITLVLHYPPWRQ